MLIVVLHRISSEGCLFVQQSTLLGYGKNPYELQEYNPSFPSSWQIMCQMKLIL